MTKKNEADSRADENSKKKKKREGNSGKNSDSSITDPAQELTESIHIEQENTQDDINLDDSWGLSEEDPDDMLELLTFTLEGEEYGINVFELKEIIRPVGLTYVPRAPDYINGIVSLRGLIIPMLHMKKILGLDNNITNTDSRYIFVYSQKGIIGFIADTVRDVLRIRESSLEPLPTMKQIRTDLLAGVGRCENRMIIILKFENIISIIENLNNNEQTSEV